MAKPVILGYVDPVSAKYRQSVLGDSCISRIGGPPATLKSVPELDASILNCSKCSQKFSLLLQLFAPEAEDRPQAYVRIVYVFVCKNGQCSQGQWSSSFKVLRSQSTETEIKPITGDYEGFPLLEISSEAEPDASVESMQPAKSQGPASNANSHPLMIENDGSEKYVKVKGDTAFYKFNKRLDLAPKQVLRYLRTGAVLESSDTVTLWIADKDKLGDKDIPACEHCKAPRSIEFQIMPTLLSYLDLDDTKADSLDWGVLNVYTCNEACDTANKVFVEEKLYSQQYDMKTSIF